VELQCSARMACLTTARPLIAAPGFERCRSWSRRWLFRVEAMPFVCNKYPSLSYFSLDSKSKLSHGFCSFFYLLHLAANKSIMPPKESASCAVCGKGKAVNFKEETMDKIRAHFDTKKAADQKACRSCNMKMIAANRKATE